MLSLVPRTDLLIECITGIQCFDSALLVLNPCFSAADRHQH